MSDGPYYMACLDVRGRDCLVVGGGRVAAEKAQGLLECAASRDCRRAGDRRGVRATRRAAIRRRPFTDSDVVGRFLVIAATSDRRVNSAVSAAADRRADALQRRRRSRALQLHPPGGRPAGADRRSASRQAARRRRSPSGSATTSQSSSAPSTPSSPSGSRPCGRGRARRLPTYEARRDYFQPARRGGAGVSVAIVGAGPGDPGLITVRALELVRECRILVYDRLVSAELVRRGNPGDPDPARGALAGAGERDPGPARPPRPAGRSAEGRRPVRVRTRRRGGRGARGGRSAV